MLLLINRQVGFNSNSCYTYAVLYQSKSIFFIYTIPVHTNLLAIKLIAFPAFK